jgi:hypothetical protein
VQNIREGTAAKPVVMTSGKAAPTERKWGGLIICGDEVNTEITEHQVEDYYTAETIMMTTLENQLLENFLHCKIQ